MSVDGDRPDPNSQALGRSLQTLRARQALTQDQVARRAGIARAHYAALEAGNSSNGSTANPRLRTLLNLAAALRVPITTLMEGLEGEAVDDA